MSDWDLVAQRGAQGDSSGQLLAGPLILDTNFEMAADGTPEDVFGVTALSFVFDGRPVIIKMAGGSLSHDDAATRLITLSIQRAADSAAQHLFAPTIATGGFWPIATECPPFTVWPSDGDPLVIGDPYGITVNLTAPASVKGKINASPAPFTNRFGLWVVTG